MCTAPGQKCLVALRWTSPIPDIHWSWCKRQWSLLRLMASSTEPLKFFHWHTRYDICNTATIIHLTSYGHNMAVPLLQPRVCQMLVDSVLSNRLMGVTADPSTDAMWAVRRTTIVIGCQHDPNRVFLYGLPANSHCCCCCRRRRRRRHHHHHLIIGASWLQLYSTNVYSATYRAGQAALHKQQAAR